MFGAGIRRIREKRRLTQEGLARMLGVSRQAVSMWESDRRDIQARTLAKIAKVLNVSIDEIIRIYESILERKEGETMATKATKKGVTFELKAPNARQVFLTGDFNSWDKSRMAMTRNKNGIWTRELDLRPGRYEYRFLVDGNWWTDPDNSATVTNPYGSKNSVMVISRK